jgi:hypothetical protein
MCFIYDGKLTQELKERVKDFLSNLKFSGWKMVGVIPDSYFEQRG